MDLLRGDIKRIYFKYLSAAFGGAMIGSIYSFVDMIVVGQYHGPLGTAALAVFAPIWNILYSLGLLFGIGGAVIFSVVRGQRHDSDKENGFFTVSLLSSSIIGIIIWIVFWVFDTEILKIFGADTELLPICMRYLQPIKFVIPVYIFSQLLSSFLRNDNDPVRATVAVLAGGGFNIFGDVFFVFGLDMGIFGAGLATAAGNLITLAILSTHFLSKKNTLRIVSVKWFRHKLFAIIQTGFATFFVDVAMGIVTMLRLQCGAGVTADNFYEFRGSKIWTD
ncbi:multidrug export protein MepA [Lachnospiraceae bacterium]|nr:multidrug export protein MepA [Lachnospiraceae bacterium]